MGSFLDKLTAPSTDDPATISAYTEHLSKLITDNKIMIFSKTYCPYCTRAKRILDERSLAYHVVELDRSSQCPNNDCAPLTRALMAQTRMRTVPQIFINGKLVGGCDQLESIASKSGKLEELLEQKPDVKVDE